MNVLLTRDETMLVVKLNTRGEVAYERQTMHAVKLRSGELAVKHWMLSSPPGRAI